MEAKIDFKNLPPVGSKEYSDLMTASVDYLVEVETPRIFYNAIINGEEGIVRLLVDNPLLKLNVVWGTETWLDMATRARNQTIVELIVNEMIRRQCRIPEMVFGNAIIKGTLATVELYLRQNNNSISSAISSQFYISPFAAAVLKGHLQIARKLLEAGCDVNATNSDGTTVLMHILICRPISNLISFLLDCPGIRLDLKDSEGKTALEIARSNNCSAEIVSLIEMKLKNLAKQTSTNDTQTKESKPDSSLGKFFKENQNSDAPSQSVFEEVIYKGP